MKNKQPQPTQTPVKIIPPRLPATAQNRAAFARILRQIATRVVEDQQPQEAKSA